MNINVPSSLRIGFPPKVSRKSKAIQSAVETSRRAGFTIALRWEARALLQLISINSRLIFACPCSDLAVQLKIIVLAAAVTASQGSPVSPPTSRPGPREPRPRPEPPSPHPEPQRLDEISDSDFVNRLLSWHSRFRLSPAPARIHLIDGFTLASTSVSGYSHV